MEGGEFLKYRRVWWRRRRFLSTLTVVDLVLTTTSDASTIITILPLALLYKNFTGCCPCQVAGLQKDPTKVKNTEDYYTDNRNCESIHR